MELLLGLNPYGLTFTLGLQGNPTGLGLEGFLEVALTVGCRSIELHAPWLAPLSDESLAALRHRLAAHALVPIVSLGPPMDDLASAIRAAGALGANTLRLGLTPVLCGARASHGERWPKMVAQARAELRAHAPIAAQSGIHFAIEDHQDFGSDELVAFCQEAGPNVGICLDTGNPLSVGESPLAFTRRVAPFVRHVHLKDYRAQFTAEGYRLVRCAIGEGAIPFAEILGILSDRHATLTASLEPGALEARHIRLFAQDWWQGYAPRDARELADCLAAASVRKLDEQAAYQTPWEQRAPAWEIIAYERDMLARSVENARAWGTWKNH